VIRGELTVVRPATAADAELLAGWHADPEVSRFWDDETYTVEQMRAELEEPNVEPYVVEADGEPVGYLQAWWEEATPDQGGLDMFLVPGARGRGLGPDAARALARHLREERGWTRVTTDPYTWNERAVRAWGRAGFVPVEERPADAGHTAAWLLMVWAG